MTSLNDYVREVVNKIEDDFTFAVAYNENGRLIVDSDYHRDERSDLKESLKLKLKQTISLVLDRAMEAVPKEAGDEDFSSDGFDDERLCAKVYNSCREETLANLEALKKSIK